MVLTSSYEKVGISGRESGRARKHTFTAEQNESNLGAPRNAHNSILKKQITLNNRKLSRSHIAIMLHTRHTNIHTCQYVADMAVIIKLVFALPQ